ncbi:hypothetical protein RKD47_001585 [Streptomyces albogriseolus]
MTERSAVCSICVTIWAVVHPGCFSLSRAATPAAKGAEKLVPLSVHWPPPGTVETMSTPGAATPTKLPVWEKAARSLFRSEEATASTPSKAAG